MTATIDTAAAVAALAEVEAKVRASAEASASDRQPRTRVALDGVGDTASVRASLTRAWRLIGQPIVVVVPPHWGPTERAAVDWCAEHAVAGIGLEVRYTVLAAHPHCVVVPAAGPVPWCGCVHPPCARCWAQDDEPPRCPGCGSPLCPDCRGAR